MVAQSQTSGTIESLGARLLRFHRDNEQACFIPEEGDGNCFWRSIARQEVMTTIFRYADEDHSRVVMPPQSKEGDKDFLDRLLATWDIR